jgi:hypothetical protein
MTKEDKKMNKGNRDKVLFGGLALLIFLLTGFVAYLLLGNRGALGNFTPDNDDKIKFTADANADDGDIIGQSKEEIVAALNEKVQDGMINISMNPNPTFGDGESKGNLGIVNNEINNYPQMVEIYTKDTNELIYTGGVEVGHKIETSTLSVDLPAGTYDCVAYFHAVDPKTDTRVGTAGMNIIITILA